MFELKLLFLLFPFIVPGLTEDSIQFSVNYFYERKVPSVCLIICESDTRWHVNFAKAAFNKSISVSRIEHDDLSDGNMHQCFRYYETPVGVLIKSDCWFLDKIFYLSSKNTLLDSIHVWLILNHYNTSETTRNTTLEATQLSENTTSSHISIDTDGVMNILGDMNISVNCDIVLATRTGPYEYSLYDIFNFGKVQGGILIVKEAGYWQLSGGLKTNLNDYKYYRRWDFGQWPMRIISVITTPLHKFDPSMLTSTKPVPGVSPITTSSTMVLMEVSKLHNFRFIHTVTDRWVGKFERNASRVVSNALYFKEQDITSVIRFMKPISEKIGIIHPSLTSLETRYYYRIPTTGPGNIENQFLRPLSAEAWWGMIGVMILCTIIVFVSSRFEARPSSIQYAIFSVTASICQQFFEDDAQPGRLSGARKLTIFITGISCVLLYNYYTSSVVSWLLNGPPPSINSLEELLDSPLELIYEDVGYFRSWLNTPNYYFNKRNAIAEDALRKKVLKKRKSMAVTRPIEEGIALVKAGGYAYHTDTYSADQLISQSFTQPELCELGSLSSMEKTLLYVAVQKHSPYKEFLTWSMTRLLERGIVSCIQRRTTPQAAVCEGSSPRALALGGAAPAFILLAVGCLVAGAIMFLEKLTDKMKPQRRSRH